MDENTNKILDEAMAQIKLGNIQALGSIYDKLGNLIHSIALSITHNLYDSQDILQETLYEIVKSANQYKENTNAKAWILKIVKNKSYDLMRKNKFKSYQDVNNIDEKLSNYMDYSMFETFDMLNSLSFEDRFIVVYKIYADLSFQDIADTLNMSYAAVNKRYNRALAKLRNYEQRGESWKKI